ncbi:MAG: YfiR family protein [Salibacteraceae bacterium]|nr:YfiR family protein [Salibacteraceae bacterium]MDP4687272.1 YfiR family protein [Salibacteraceae bacterium]MDP4762974.1 YfiR family protein [Salibacteraceae bacterium]MDP4844365.1 YfiR family protein [Salibacteraceae bacterium]MDP4933794.1 YfiR family protein [Salibacteraceae bacterium]
MKKLLLAILLITSSVSMSFSQATMNTMNTRAKFKSLFIYNFTKLTEWPESYKQGDFIIGVVNDVDLAEQLELAAKTKKINSQNVVIKKINSTADVSKCHVLYVSGSTAGEVDPFIKKAKDFNCLIITEGKGLAENTSAINFVIVGSAIQFEMNKSLFESKQLIVGNSLEKLATKVIN